MKKFKLKLKKSIMFALTSIFMTACGENPYIEESNNYDYKTMVNNNYLSVYKCDFSNDDILELPSSLKTLDLSDCHYVDSLDELPNICPNLEYLTIDNCSSLTDFSFVYNLDNLKSLRVYESAFIDENLINYLEKSNINTNITYKDLEYVEKVNEIYDSVITGNETDKEKIKNLVFYVTNNFKYKLSLSDDSNFSPLTCMFDNNAGVCYSYAYLTNILLRKANIESYQVISTNHTWNLVKLDDKYYYIDPTNVDFLLNEFECKKSDSGIFYMSDPKSNFLSSMQDYDDLTKVVIPSSLVEDIKNSENTKTIYEKYSNSVPILLIKMLIIGIGIGAIAVKIDDKIHRKVKE